jgi:hypothetical protein
LFQIRRTFNGVECWFCYFHYFLLATIAVGLIGGWIANITRDHTAAADDDLALAIRTERSALLIEDSNFRPGRYTSGARLAYGRGSGLQAI